tara:strand:- start:279 stop:677 length:399 start_codon:yes stop_codon:yes gene_type:complete
MNFRDKVVEFRGSCHIETNLSLVELANKVSIALCGGLSFTYGKHSIWEEIPSMYIENSIMGMFIIIGGYGGKEGFEIVIWPFGEFGRYLDANNLNNKRVKINLDFHLYHLLKQGLSDYPEIKIIEPEVPPLA